MRDPELAARIVRETVKRIRKPVTVKFRKGFNDREVNAVEFAKRLEDAGAAAVTVHGRTREQYYAGKADWDIIRAVKEAVSIPVIGNGDVTDPASAWALQDYTGCDGVMIGRAARGNPWIFSRILEERRTGTDPGRPAISEVRKMILRHAQMTVEFKGEYTGIREMRKHVAWYTTGFRNASVLRGASNRICTLADLNELLLTLPDV
jgi:nifR3 family TIM-barrel protein